jgi:hypothetical protein
MSKTITVRGQAPVSIDKDQLLRDAYEQDLISATRRFYSESKRKGLPVTESEARQAVAARYDQGEYDQLPNYHRVAKRLAGADVPARRVGEEPR